MSPMHSAGACTGYRPSYTIWAEAEEATLRVDEKALLCRKLYNAVGHSSKNRGAYEDAS